MGDASQVDLGGLTLVCNGLRVGATAPGQAGTELTGSEIALLDGLTAGTVTASKAVVVDANKDSGDFRNLDAVNFDAGASGTAGTVDVFPTTAAKGKLNIAAADSAGDTTTTITNASQAGARTYTIPDAGASASFVMTEGAQTVNGLKTFGNGIGGGVQLLTGAGAVNLTTLTTILTTTGSDAITLADGTNGQLKIIVHGTDGGAATITPTTLANGNTLTMSEAGDSVMLVFATADGWHVVANNGTVVG
jgi:hypothetical protein